MSSPDPSIAAQNLHEAMKGAGTDEDAIIEILAKGSYKNRQKIAEAYKAQYGEDLLEKIQSELSGYFEQVTLWSFFSREQLNALALRKAMESAGTKEGMLIDIICTATNSQIIKMKSTYEALTGRNLEDDISRETSGDFQNVLIAILQGKRETNVNRTEAKQDAQDIFDAGEGKLGTDESEITRILCSRSHEQIKLINQLYAEISDQELIEAIKKETSGHYKKALCRIIEFSQDEYGTLAEMLYESMKGMGTDDDSLMRIILAHDNNDLNKIQSVFETTYEKSLVDMISGDTSGDYRNFLLAVLSWK